MSITSVASATTVHAPSQIQQAPRLARADRDGDEATESAASKAKEAAKPVNPNLGKSLNVSA